MSHSRSPFGDWQSYLRSVFERDAAWSDTPTIHYCDADDDVLLLTAASVTSRIYATLSLPR
jgi:hypothetical protein